MLVCFDLYVGSMEDIQMAYFGLSQNSSSADTATQGA